MNLRTDIEYCVHCDEQGNIIGPISKTHAHLPGVRETLTHYSTWSMVFNPITREYGIQLKNQKKHDKHTGGKWDMGVAGHNCYIKENDQWRPTAFSENLNKEAEEEIGLPLKMFDDLEKFTSCINNLSNFSAGYIFDEFFYKTDLNNEWVGLGLILTTKTELDFPDGEVVDFKWLSSDKLESFIENNDNYCSPLPLVFEKAKKFIRDNNL